MDYALDPKNGKLRTAFVDDEPVCLVRYDGRRNYTTVTLEGVDLSAGHPTIADAVAEGMRRIDEGWPKPDPITLSLIHI